MKIVFRLLWIKKGTPLRRGFKTTETLALFEDYISRIKRFVPCEAEGRPGPEESFGGGRVVWWCDRGPKAKVLSSEDLAKAVDKAAQGAIRELHLFIGSADGFTPEEERLFPPAMRWSFGSLTLPHELAAVVSSEQIYRAWSILKKLPYHGGH